MQIIPLNKVAPTSGPVAINTNASSVYAVNKIVIQALPGNEGNVYVGTAVDMNKTTYAKVFQVLTPGSSMSLGDELGSNTVSIDRIFIDGDAVTDVVVAAAILR